MEPVQPTINATDTTNATNTTNEPVVPVQPQPEPVVPSTPEVKKSSNFLPFVLSILLILVCLVAGYFFWQVQILKQEIGKLDDSVSSQTPTPDPLSSETLVKEDTTDWKTYTNEKYGFSFKYPKEYIHDTKNTSLIPLIVSFYKNPDVGQEFYVAYHNNIGSLSDWLVKNQAGKIIENESINDNLFTVIAGGALYTSKEYAIKINRSDYLRFVFEENPDQKMIITDEIAYQILSTFKFTN